MIYSMMSLTSDGMARELAERMAAAYPEYANLLPDAVEEELAQRGAEETPAHYDTAIVVAIASLVVACGQLAFQWRDLQRHGPTAPAPPPSDQSSLVPSPMAHGWQSLELHLEAQAPLPPGVTLELRAWAIMESGRIVEESGHERPDA